MKKRIRIKNINKGFTLVEVIIAMTLIGMVAAIAGSMINFSFKAEKKAEEEYDLQAEVRLAAEVVNNALRNTSVTFLMNGKMPETKAQGWNYIGMSADGTEILQYTWDEVSNSHTEKRLLQARPASNYVLDFSNPKSTKLIDYTIGFDQVNSNNFEVKSSVNAVNSIAIDYIKDEKNPSQVLAYRLDERPKAGKDTKGAVVITMVLDTSGSMAYDMGGSGKDKNKIRMTIMKEKAKALVGDFPENVHLSIFEYSTDADDAMGREFIKLDTEGKKNTVKSTIEGFRATGGTNTGDALRRAYHKLGEYVPQPNEEPLNYIILLTDGNPTYYSHTATDGFWSGPWWNQTWVEKSKYGNSTRQAKIPDDEYQVDANAAKWVSGPGNDDDNGKNCLNYATYMGSIIAGDTSKNIKTFVIGFSGVNSEITKAETIATSANKAGTKVEDVYFEAGSGEELGIAFDAIKEAILTEYWHIYGPYGKPAD